MEIIDDTKQIENEVENNETENIYDETETIDDEINEVDNINKDIINLYTKHTQTEECHEMNEINKQLTDINIIKKMKRTELINKIIEMDTGITKTELNRMKKDDLVNIIINNEVYEENEMNEQKKPPRKYLVDGLERINTIMCFGVETIGNTYLRDTEYDISGLTNSTRDNKNRKILRDIFNEFVSEYPKQCEMFNNVFLNYSLAMGSLVTNQLAVNKLDGKKKLSNKKSEHAGNSEKCNEGNNVIASNGDNPPENNKMYNNDKKHSTPIITTCGVFPS